jgi:hypothetical protein
VAKANTDLYSCCLQSSKQSNQRKKLKKFVFVISIGLMHVAGTTIRIDEGSSWKSHKDEKGIDFKVFRAAHRQTLLTADA